MLARLFEELSALVSLALFLSVLLLWADLIPYIKFGN